MLRQIKRAKTRRTGAIREGEASCGHASVFHRLSSGLLLLLLFLSPLLLPERAHARAVSVYTLAKVRLDVRAQNAVKAKQQAMKAAPLLALKLIFRRFAPFRAYDRLPTLTAEEADDVIEGFTVRSERYSPTRYLALLDYNFSKSRLRRLMLKKGVPFFDGRSRPFAIMPVMTASGDEQADRKKARIWQKAWRTIDLKHALTRARLRKASSSDQQKWQKISSGDLAPYASLRQHVASHRLLLIDAHPNEQEDHMVLRIFGQDRVGPIDYKQEFPMDREQPHALRSAFEQAAALAFGIIEGRWREPQIVGEVVAVSLSSPESSAEQAQEVGRRLVNETFFMRVTFRGLRDWQRIKRRLQRIPGVQELEVNSLSPRGADVKMSYPGGANRLQARLSPYGFAMERNGSDLTLRSIR